MTERPRKNKIETRLRSFRTVSSESLLRHRCFAFKAEGLRTNHRSHPEPSFDQREFYLQLVGYGRLEKSACIIHNQFPNPELKMNQHPGQLPTPPSSCRCLFLSSVLFFVFAFLLFPFLQLLNDDA